MRINLTDNNFTQQSSNTFYRKDVSALFPIANKTVAELCREYENLLLFPFSIDTTDDRIGASSVLSIQNTDDPEKVCIITENIMGFIGVGDLQIKINSRFESGQDDFLLHYMLQKVLSFNLFDLNHSSEQEDVFDFLILMFPYFLKSAMRQGIYREYQNHPHNDSNLKGNIDIGRHISKNVPFAGKIAYTTREYSHDNSVTELIRHTVEFMRTKKYGQSVLNLDQETIENVIALVECTPSYNKCDRNNVISKNLRLKKHPYYTEYYPLQMLCLQILKMEEVKYGESDDEICGILFDGAWLWEEYVNTLLKSRGFIHPENKLHKGGIYLFDDNTGIRYPDFYKDDFVLDAKYKRLGECKNISQLDRNDVHQLMAYITTLRASRGGFVFPLEQKQTNIPTSRLNGNSALLSIYGIEISQTAKSYADFQIQMQHNEAAFIESLGNL